MRSARILRALVVPCFFALGAWSQVASAAGGGAAAAAADASAADPMTSEAKARFKEGLELYKAHKNEAARTKYLQALALSQAATIYLNLAVVEYDLMLYPDALKHAKAYVVHPKADPAKVEKLKREMIPELQAKTGHVLVQGQAGEAVFVDGEKVGIAPLADSVDVNPGDHSVACGTITKSVTVKAGDSATVIVVVETGPAPTTAAPVNPPPALTTQPPPNPPPSNPPPVADGAEKPGKARWIGPIVLGVVGAGGIVTGAIFAGNSNSDRDDQKSIQRTAGGHACVDQASASCDSFKSKGSDSDSAKTVSIVGYVAGGALLAGALAWTGYNVFHSSDGKAASGGSGVSLQPWFGARSGGLTFDLTY